MELLLNIRRALKKRKPNFNRSDFHKKAKLKKTWRKPNGHQNKMRLKKKGYNRCVSKGWRSPSKIRGFDRSGLIPVIINNTKDLEKINPKTQGIIISSSVGAKKRLAIIDSAKDFKILNIKDVNSYITKVNENFKNRKNKKSLRLEKTKQSKPVEKKAESKKELSPEEKEKKIKEEKDKILRTKA